MPPVPSSWTAISLSTSFGPRKTRASPMATMRTIRPAAVRRSSFMADRLFEQGLILNHGRRYRLQSIETVHLKHFAFRACGHGSRLKARIHEKGVACAAGRQGEGDRNESGTQIEARQKCTPRHIGSRDNRAAQEAKGEFGKR